MQGPVEHNHSYSRKKLESPLLITWCSFSFSSIWTEQARSITYFYYMKQTVSNITSWLKIKLNKCLLGFPYTESPSQKMQLFSSPKGGYGFRRSMRRLRKLGTRTRHLDLSSVVPSSTPRPRSVNSQLVSLPPVGSLNSLCYIYNICLFFYSVPNSHSSA